MAQWKYFTERRGCPIKILRRGYKILRGIGYFSTPVEVLDICLTHVGEKFFAICLRKCLKSCLSSFYGLFYQEMSTSKVLHLAGKDDWIWVSLNPPTRNWIFYVIFMNTDIVISLCFFRNSCSFTLIKWERSRSLQWLSQQDLQRSR